MIQYPLFFKGQSQSEAKIGTKWEAKCSALTPITCAIPHEFNGPGGGYSPEDLFGLALLTCFIATFKVFAERASLDYKTLTGEVTLTLERDEKKCVRVTKARLELELAAPSDEAKARELLEEAKQNCLVAHSINASVDFVFNLA